MAKLLEAVRNSPLVKRRVGGYSVLDSEARDPFVQGICFSAHFVGSGEVTTKQDSPEVQDKVKEIWDKGQRKKSSLTKVTITIKSNIVRVRDPSTKYEDSYPIYLVSYCGAAAEVDLVFYFIHKTKLDRILRVEVFKMSTKDKVTAITLTLAKAFNIAFKAWMAEKRAREKDRNRSSPDSSPGSEPKDTSHLKKIAPGLATKSSGPYTPQAPRKVEEASQPKRRGSFGDSPDGGVAPKNPAVKRLQTTNVATGSTHDVTITDEFDKGFQELVDVPSSPTPEVLPTSLAEPVDVFNLEEIKKHADSAENGTGDSH